MELIIAIESSCTSFWYKTIIIDGRRDGKYDLWGRTYIKHMVQRDWQCFGGRVWS